QNGAGPGAQALIELSADNLTYTEHEARAIETQNTSLETLNIPVTTATEYIRLTQAFKDAADFNLRIDAITYSYETTSCDEPFTDTDDDGIADYLDLDTDNDGIPDIVEAGGADKDGDGTVDNTTDTDGDGLVDIYDNDDTDGPDVSGCTLGLDCDLSNSTSVLFDTNGDGANDEDADFDGDGIPNWLDLDSDNDGILDVIEVGGTDDNNDGQIDDNSLDADNDGFADGVDGDVGNDGTAENTSNALVPTTEDVDEDGLPDNGYTASADVDGEGLPNFLDIDADNDGIVDNIEAQATGSYTPPDNNDADGDGIDDAYDNFNGFGGDGIDPVNSDGAADNDDYLDINSDDDGELDSVEGHDSNGDGTPDNGSLAHSGQATGLDIDGDGLDDGYDNNTGSADPTNSTGPGSYPIVDAGSDQDWRSSNGTTFPVEWLEFVVEGRGSEALLRWTTAREVNSDYFDVERSVDGQFYESIGQVSSAGTVDHLSFYQFTDRNLPGLRMYYRLRQVDLDGQQDYSNVVELQLTPETSFEISLYPNPATDQTSVRISEVGLENVEIGLYSLAGQQLWSQMTSQTHTDIPLQQLSPGVYIVRVSKGGFIQSKQLLVK
ncbi:MAG: T9SS type A sorting domain-containing protein, partial [Bacteroidota bacterium]